MAFAVRIVAYAYLAINVFLQLGVQGFIFKKCYDDIGCFSLQPPFTSKARPVSLMPASPNDIKTQFLLYTRQNPEEGQLLDALRVQELKETWTRFENRSTKVIVHGFVDNYNIVAWPTEMKDELLTHGDYNTIIVDWHQGNLPPYTQATANTRVVGAQVAVLIKQLQMEYNISAEQFHIIGHSLGAHVAGYAGERVMGLGRITGLDPANLYFMGTPTVVRLDPTDALLVDVIHSDVKDSDSSAADAMGHMNFYPNLGRDQPGCEKKVFNLASMFVFKGARELLYCSHLRSIKFFTESINSRCSFMSIHCNSEKDYITDSCLRGDVSEWASMGFHADEHKPPADNYLKYYTATTKEAPFCLYHIEVKIRLSNSSKARSEKGTSMIRLHGDHAISKWLQLDKEPIVYQAGETYESTVWLPQDVGILFSIEFKWQHEKKSVLNPFKLFGRRRRRVLNLQGVGIIRLEEGLETGFCADETEMTVQSGKTKLLFNPC